jgi:hemerythrin
MPIVVWTPRYSVRVRELDEQHKQIFTLINDFHDSLKKGEGKKTTSPILQRMIDYAAVHFSTEEKYMVRYDYPDFSRHKKDHEYFVMKVMEFQRDFEGGRLSVPLEVMDFLMGWLLEHIQHTDAKYGPFFNERGLV